MRLDTAFGPQVSLTQQRDKLKFIGHLHLSSDAHVSSGVVEYPLEILSTFDVLKVETVDGPVPVGQRRTADRVDVCMHERQVRRNGSDSGSFRSTVHNVSYAAA